MKQLHRMKAFAAYQGAREVLDKDMTYPAYLLLKEAAIGVLSYGVESHYRMELSNKTNLVKLLDLTDGVLVFDDDIKILNIFKEKSSEGLGAILTVDQEELLLLKDVIKKLMVDILDADV